MANHYNMTPRNPVKAPRASASLVAVIASAANLQRATKLRRPPDLFELRLDALAADLPETKRRLPELRAPLILTARHPLEGGQNNLSAARRSELLLEFLPWAAFVDVELRSIRELRRVLRTAQQSGVRRIISVHEMEQPLAPKQFEKFLAAARKQSADIFKIVTRTDTEAEVEALTKFFRAHQHQIALSAMGTGRLGRSARIELAPTGSVLNYVHLGSAQLAGQLSLAEMRRALRR